VIAELAGRAFGQRGVERVILERDPFLNGEAFAMVSAFPQDVYFLTADFFDGAGFFRGARVEVGGLRASLTALPAWNRTARLLQSHDPVPYDRIIGYV
jgi:hypothetical protein